MPSGNGNLNVNRWVARRDGDTVVTQNEDAPIQ
jgi:hypothetical protein